MRQFVDLFRPDDSTRIIDVGGYEFNWTLVDCEPQVVLVNVEPDGYERGRFVKVHGDGRALKYPDGSFDIAYSNSVIEHVGTRSDQISFANEIRRVARRYYVQTPNKYFWIEPHLIAPGIHLLPPHIGRRLVRYFSVWGLVTKPDRAEVDSFLDSIRLLSKQDLQELFPDAEILEEKFLGQTKSLIAVRR